jgi:hypothetical protein
VPGGWRILIYHSIKNKNARSLTINLGDISQLHAYFLQGGPMSEQLEVNVKVVM